jgi:hypothetical protein
MKKNILKILGHPGAPEDPPKYRGFAHFQGVLLAPLGDPKISFFFSIQVKIFE